MRSKAFERNPSLVGVCNSSFISLIPKVKDYLGLGDYQPIHFIGCVSKISLKLLAERLKTILIDIIGPVQTAFVKGKQSMDGPIIVNEIISWAKRVKKMMFILKVDFDIAFDNV